MDLFNDVICLVTAVPHFMSIIKNSHKMTYLPISNKRSLGKYRDTTEITNSSRQVILRKMPKMEKTSLRNAITCLYSETAWAN